MNIEDQILISILVIVIVIIICSFAALIMNDSTNHYCVVLGYDGGEHLFWKAKDVCWNVIQEEKIEYFPLEK